MLKSFYEFAKESRAELEVIFVSSDRSERDMINYYQQSHGSWLAVPFFSNQRNFLSTHFSVKGIPALFLLNRGTLHAVEADIRSTIQQVAMMKSPVHALQLVNTWREQSGSVLFERIPASLSQLTKEQRVGVFELLTKLVGNVSDHPTESKYRQLRCDNAVLKSTILDLPCGDGPLVAIGFLKDGTNYCYRPSMMEAKTGQLILTNRESNGLVELAACAPVPTVNFSSPQIPPSQSVSGRLKILHGDSAPHTTEILTFESLELLRALVESLTEVPAECQRLFSDSILKSSPLDRESDQVLASAFTVAWTNSPCVELLVLGSQTETNPSLTNLTDARANELASELRGKIVELKAAKEGSSEALALSAVFNAAIHCQIHEVPSHQAKALACVPVLQLHAIGAQKIFPSYAESLLLATLAWFKKDFFKWLDKPRCSQCQSVSTSLVNAHSPPSVEETKGLARTVELYSCEVCGALTRFPRFNHPVALLHTREGRCGEWANCFTLICRSLGFEVRQVHDSADHVWVEVWIEARRQWVHCDPCEGAWDKPLLYEQGWGKEVGFVFACSKDGARDVTRRYTSKSWSRAMGALVMQNLNRLLQAHNSGEEELVLAKLAQRDSEEEVELDQKNLAKQPNCQLGGRTSGSAEWVTSRGEGGSASSSFFIGNDNDEIQKSKSHGGVHADTLPFSDEHVIRSCAAGSSIPKISKISLWQDGTAVTGIRAEWSSNSAASHQTPSATNTDHTSMLALDSDEFIISINLRCGGLVDYIELSTNKARSVSAGNPNGGQIAQIDVGDGMHVVGFVGGLGGHIHNLGILTAPLPDNVSECDSMSPEGERVRDIFAQLVAQGWDATDAAVEAIKRVRSHP